MREFVKFFGGGVLVAAAGAWKLKGPQWGIVAELGPFPDVTAGDLIGIPVAAVGFAAMASAAPAPVGRRAVGVVSLIAAVLWVTSEWPWEDPLVPGLQWRRHGVHLLDALAVVPLVIGVAALWPWRARRRPALRVHRG